MNRSRSKTPLGIATVIGMYLAYLGVMLSFSDERVMPYGMQVILSFVAASAVYTLGVVVGAVLDRNVSAKGGPPGPPPAMSPAGIPVGPRRPSPSVAHATPAPDEASVFGR